MRSPLYHTHTLFLSHVCSQTDPNLTPLSHTQTHIKIPALLYLTHIHTLTHTHIATLVSLSHTFTLTPLHLTDTLTPRPFAHTPKTLSPFTLSLPYSHVFLYLTNTHLFLLHTYR